MKLYKFVGNGTGVPGIPHEISKTEGDQNIKDFERALKKEMAEKKTDVGPFQASQMPGAILKGALAIGNYEDLSTKKPKASSEEPPEEKEIE